MAQIIVRNLDQRVVERLRSRAEGHNRSLEAEIRDILEAEAMPASDQRKLVRQLAAQMRRELSGVQQSDSTEMVRADRDR